MESNLNGAGACAGNGANGSAGPTGGNSGPEPVRHGWFCCCLYCLSGICG